MAHCSNPDCHHRARTGKPAEYRDGLETCADREEPQGVFVLAGRRLRAHTWFFGPYVPPRILGDPSTHSQD